MLWVEDVFDYDAEGNVTRVTRLDGTPDAVTTTFSYEPTFSQLASVTDPLNHTSNFYYDPTGVLSSAADPLNHSTAFSFVNGLLSSVTDPLNNVTQFSYFGSDPVGVTDPLENFSSQSLDGGGRVVSSFDAQGNETRFQYNNLNLVTQVTDPQGNNTSFAYDANGNLLTLTDANQHATNWTYDNMDRVQTRTDPLLRPDKFKLRPDAQSGEQHGSQGPGDHVRI